MSTVESPVESAVEIAAATIRQGGFTLTADLRLPSGSITALVGPSGGGKSTLIGAIAGFAPVTAGAIRVGQTDITQDAPAARPVTILFQENNLFPSLTALENTALALQPRRRPDRAERAAAEAALAEVGLEGLGGRLPHQLSGGQRQRAALARALLRAQPVLLLDEPFAALGPGQRAEMMDLVRATAAPRGVTVLIATHDPDDARRGADGLVFCANGAVSGVAPLPDALDAPEPALAAYLGRAVTE